MFFKFVLIFNVTLLLVMPLQSSHAAGEKPDQISNTLPEPLTLDIALKLSNENHPNLQQIDADLQYAQSALQQTLSNNDITATLKAEAGWVEPSVLATNQSNEDHRLGLYVNKTLYDFGRSSAYTGAASQRVISQNLRYKHAKQTQYLNVMKAYFNVVLADLQFYRYNEEMAVAYIQFDRSSKRQKLGQRTELEVAKKEVEYHKIRRLRTYSQNQQRVTRAILAESLNTPDNLPSTVTKPNLRVMSRKLPDEEILQKEVHDNNPLLLALRAEIIAAKQKVLLARSNSNPTITGALEAFSYTRETASSDKWRAKIILNVPLWSGNRIDAAVAKAKSNVYKLEALLSQQERKIQQNVLELWLGIETLRLKHSEAVAGMNLSELTLDQSRALYELEVKSDLGYSMVNFTSSERNVVKTDFEIALSWAQLDALSGTLVK